jgi:hypothetical protein
MRASRSPARPAARRCWQKGPSSQKAVLRACFGQRGTRLYPSVVITGPPLPGTRAGPWPQYWQKTCLQTRGRAPHEKGTNSRRPATRRPLGGSRLAGTRIGTRIGNQMGTRMGDLASMRPAADPHHAATPDHAHSFTPLPGYSRTLSRLGPPAQTTGAGVAEGRLSTNDRSEPPL